ncbi:MAG: SPASM domain-containing protein [bacterium]
MWKSSLLKLDGPLSCSILLDKASGNQGEKGRLSLEEWQNLFRELKAFVTDLHVYCEKPEEDLEYFFNILRLIEAQNIRFHVHCSGLWDEPREFLMAIKEFSHFLYLYLTVYGAEAESHSKISGNNRFDELDANIKLANLYACDMVASSELNKSNLHELEDMIQHYQNIGVRRVEFERRVAGPNPETDLSDKEFEDALIRVDQMAQEGWRTAVGGCFPQCFCNAVKSVCRGGGVNFCAIDSSGFVRPCLHSELKAGQVTKGGFERIWKGRLMKKWGENNPSECRDCDAFRSYLCFGGCKCLSEKLNVARDPLIRKPVKLDDFKTSPEIKLDGSLCPLPRYEVRKESFGFILMHDGQFIPIKKGASALLSAMDGETSLKKLEGQFGKEVVPLIFSLYLRKFLVFRTIMTEQPLQPPPASQQRRPQEQRNMPGGPQEQCNMPRR